MQSSGGITVACDSAAREPVRTVLSGPAGGVVGAAAMARRSGFERIISFDMGGTSTDVALVDGEAEASGRGRNRRTARRACPCSTSTPSAPAEARSPASTPPGRCAWGRSRRAPIPVQSATDAALQPTVTDANLTAGAVAAGHGFWAATFELDLERTRRITREWLKQQRSRLSLEQFAAGVVRVVNATMEKAIRVVSIERGYDPREFALVAFGGAGGLHACELAEALGIPRVIVPALPGALSAYGILVSDVVKDYSRTVLRRAFDKLPGKQLDLEFARCGGRRRRISGTSNGKAKSAVS